MNTADDCLMHVFLDILKYDQKICKRFVFQAVLI